MEEPSWKVRSAGRSVRTPALAAAILLLGSVLAATGASLVERWQRSSARGQSLAFEDLLGIAVNTMGLIIVAWWVLSMLIALASAALERTGNGRAAEATGKFSPAFMRRLALAAVGLQLLGAPLAHGARTPETRRPSPNPATAIAAVWAPTEQAAGGASARSVRAGCTRHRIAEAAVQLDLRAAGNLSVR